MLNPPFIIAILLALTIHEWAHALVANHLGDPTAREEGRLTLNPIAHLDPLGTLMFFLVQFGWGKPVPINPRYFKHPRRDSALVSIAGPVSNFILAFVSLLLLVWLSPETLQVGAAHDLLFSGGIGDRLQAFIGQTLANLLFVNLALMAFNLLPIAPLDGSKVLQAFIPARHEFAYERFMERGPMILIGLIIAERILNVPILLTWISLIVDGALRVMLVVV